MSKIVLIQLGTSGKLSTLNRASVIAMLMSDFQHNAFLCHNSQEKDKVQEIRDRLLHRGIYGWLDKYDFRPFIPWQSQLEAILSEIQSVAIFIGASGVGPWASIEMSEFMVEFATRKIPIGLVRLPGCPNDLQRLNPPVPRFLKHFHWIDFRESDPDPIDQLVWGITGQRPQGSAVPCDNPFETNAAVNLAAPVENPAQLTAADWIDRGLAKKKAGNLPGAIADYTQALQLQPHFAEAYNHRGIARAASGDHPGAIADYTQALQLQPTYANACNNRGLSRRATGDLGGAIADYTQALQLQPGYPAACINRAGTRKAMGDLQGAIEDCDRAIELQPDSAVAWFNRACYYSLQRNSQKAVESLRGAIDRDPGYRQFAMTDTDFYPIRADWQFQQVLGQ